jgi:serine/threonine protein kinase
MSPEQARGVPDIDARTDVWSVSVVLYELVTGMLPFKIKNYNALMQAILHEQPVPTVDRGVGDKNLWRVIVKGLAKSRDRRWPSMAALGEALAFWLYDQGVTEDVCGNSLRTVWLGGTTAGQSMRPPTDSWLDQSAPAIEHAAEERAMPTLKLRFRRVQHKIQLLLTRPVLAGLGLVGLVMAVLLVYSLTSTPEEDVPPLTAPEIVVTNEPVPAKAPPATRSPQPDITKFENLPLAADSAETDKSARKRRWRPPPQPQQGPMNDTEKRLREYGL